MKISHVIFIILIIISAATFLVCDSVNESPIKDDSYFPLKVNNSWSYNDLNGNLNISNKISKKIIINSKEYFIYTNFSGDESGDTIRIENNKVYKRLNNSDNLWFDFNLENNNKYNYFDYHVTVQRNLSVKCKAGTYQNCIGFFFDIPDAVDDEHQYIFAQSIGIVKITSGWFDLSLNSYKLSN